MDSARLGSRNAALPIVMSQLGLGHVKTLAPLVSAKYSESIDIIHVIFSLFH
jgi:hypothetical protein